jgi:hypothetical protein
MESESKSMSSAPVSLSSPPEAIRQRVLAPLETLRRRTRWHLAVRGGVVLLSGIVLAAVCQLALDRWLRLSVDQRVALNLALTLVWLWLLLRYCIVPLLRPLPDHVLAAWVDAGDPSLDDRVQTAVEFANWSGPTEQHAEAPSQDLIDAVLGEVSQRVTPEAFDRVLDRRGFRRRLLMGGALLAAVAVAWLARPDILSIWFNRNWLLREQPWPQRTYLEPVGFDRGDVRRLPRGEEVEVFVDVRGEMPRTATLEWKSEDDRTGAVVLTRLSGGRLYASLGDLTDNLTFRLRGGDDHSRPFHIHAVERPRVTRSNLRVTPPAYTRVEALDFQQQTTVEVLAGSTLEILADINRPLAAARFISEDGLVITPEILPGEQPSESGAGESGPPPAARLRLAWSEPRSGVYRFELEDVDGLSNVNPLRYTLKLVPDQPPTVELSLPGVGELITPEAEMRAVLTADDVYGLSGVELTATQQGRTPESIAIPPLAASARQYAGEGLIRAPELRLRPGDRVRIRAAARDLDPAGPNVGESREFSLAVVSREDFEQALAERELELRAEFERLIAAQKSLNESYIRIEADLPASGPAPARESQRIVGLMRRQAGHAARCGVFARRYLDILDELRTNKLARIADEQRLAQRIARPLQTLESETMPAASAAWAALREDSGPVVRGTARSAQDRVLREMEAVYQQMLEWEGYREAVGALQEILDAQQQLRKETISRLERELAEILGLDTPDGEPPAAPSSQPIE